MVVTHVLGCWLFLLYLSLRSSLAAAATVNTVDVKKQTEECSECFQALRKLWLETVSKDPYSSSIIELSDDLLNQPIPSRPRRVLLNPDDIPPGFIGSRGKKMSLVKKQDAPDPGFVISRGRRSGQAAKIERSGGNYPDDWFIGTRG